MTRRIPTTRKQTFNGQFDVTRYVFCCLGCRWSVQAGYRGRSDMGGAKALLEAFATAHREHIIEAHPEPIDTVIDWGDGETHAGGQVNADGSSEAALVAHLLPEWWVDR